MKRTLFMALLLTCSAALFASCGPTKDWHLSEQCSKFLNERYANARILDVDYDDGMVEVEIRHDKKDKEVLFTNSCEWVSTSWDVAQRNVPAVVMQALQKKYPNARIDDIDFSFGHIRRYAPFRPHPQRLALHPFCKVRTILQARW